MVRHLKRLFKSTLRRRGLELVRTEQRNDLAGHLRDLLAELRVDCVFDVGANEGQFARTLREQGYEGQILSFEPNPGVAPRLAREMGRDRRWRHLPFALGDEEGRITLHVPRRSVFASASPPNAYALETFPDARFQDRHEERVSVHRLDGLFDRLRAEHGFERPFLKLDTQGYDLRVLRGAEGCLGSMVGLVTEMSLKPLYESAPDITESLNAVRTAGFEVTGIFPVVHDATGALIEVDCVARRGGRAWPLIAHASP